MSLSVTSNVSNTGYDDIDKLNNAQNELYDKAYEQQQNIVNTQTQQNIDEINRNKDKLNEETTKQNKALYTDYTKQVNPYGATAESLAMNGLGNSGVAESTKTNSYNTYQRNRTETLNTARSLLADYDAQITQAKQNGDMQLAQSALELYNQKIDNLYNTYQLMQNQKQFDYQKERDQVADNKWEKEFNYNKNVDDRNYNYQLNRDQIEDNQWQQSFDTSNRQWQQEFDYNKAIDDRNYNYQLNRDQITDNQWQQQYDYQVNRDNVADNQWEQEFELQKKNLASSSSKSSSRSSRSASTGSTGSSGGLYVVSGDNGNNLEVSGENTEQTNSEDRQNNENFDIVEYSLDKDVAGIISGTDANSTQRKRLLTGQLKIGNITQDEYNYLIGLS